MKLTPENEFRLNNIHKNELLGILSMVTSGEYDELPEASKNRIRVKLHDLKISLGYIIDQYLEYCKDMDKKLPIVQATSITNINKICEKYNISKYHCLIVPFIKEDVEKLLDLDGKYIIYTLGSKPVTIPDIKEYLQGLKFYINGGYKK
jgi:hypothetical protein